MIRPLLVLLAVCFTTTAHAQDAASPAADGPADATPAAAADAPTLVWSADKAPPLNFVLKQASAPWLRVRTPKADKSDVRARVAWPFDRSDVLLALEDEDGPFVTVDAAVGTPAKEAREGFVPRATLDEVFVEDEAGNVFNSLRAFIKTESFEGSDSADLTADSGGADGTVISEDTALDELTLLEGGNLTIAGDVTLTVFGDVTLEVGSRVSIPKGSSLTIVVLGGEVTLAGEIDNQKSSQLSVVSGAVATGGAETIRVSMGDGTFRGSVVGRNIRITSENGGKISFAYDKKPGLGVNETKTKLKIRALLKDSN